MTTAFDAWIGREDERTEQVLAPSVAAMAATLDMASAPAAGQPLPPGWQWMFFNPVVRRSGLGTDGHPQRGGFLPPIELPRRMWAGSRVRYLADLPVDAKATRRSLILKVENKVGKRGSLWFVTVEHMISCEGKPCIMEEQDIVYREATPPSTAPAVAPEPYDGQAQWSREVNPDTTLLFRYSALTFNGHRIHYDRKYVTEVEGYPGLIVHGPLIATLLVDLVRQSIPGCKLKSFEFRAIRPTFDINLFKVSAKPDLEKDPSGKTISIWAEDHEGWLTMQATAVLA